MKMIGDEIILEKQRGNISSVMANREENHQGGISSFISGPNLLTGLLATWLRRFLNHQLHIYHINDKLSFREIIFFFCPESISHTIRTMTFFHSLFGQTRLACRDNTNTLRLSKWEHHHNLSSLILFIF